MKIGDIFKDGNRTYKVIDQNESGFISKAIDGEVEEVTPVEEAPTPKRRSRKVEESV